MTLQKCFGEDSLSVPNFPRIVNELNSTYSWYFDKNSLWFNQGRQNSTNLVFRSSCIFEMAVEEPTELLNALPNTTFLILASNFNAHEILLYCLVLKNFNEEKVLSCSSLDLWFSSQLENHYVTSLKIYIYISTAPQEK